MEKRSSSNIIKFLNKEKFIENIWIAIIGFFKDIIVAIIGLFKKEKSSKTKKLPQKYDASEERRDNPFIPSNADIENIDIKDVSSSKKLH